MRKARHAQKTKRKSPVDDFQMKIKEMLMLLKDENEGNMFDFHTDKKKAKEYIHTKTFRNEY